MSNILTMLVSLDIYKPCACVWKKRSDLILQNFSPTESNYC